MATPFYHYHTSPSNGDSTHTRTYQNQSTLPHWKHSKSLEKNRSVHMRCEISKCCHLVLSTTTLVNYGHIVLTCCFRGPLPLLFRLHNAPVCKMQRASAECNYMHGVCGTTLTGAAPASNKAATIWSWWLPYAPSMHIAVLLHKHSNLCTFFCCSVWHVSTNWSASVTALCAPLMAHTVIFLKMRIKFVTTFLLHMSYALANEVLRKFIETLASWIQPFCKTSICQLE